MITAGEHVWQLSEAGDNSLGLSCTAEGLFLGRTPLIERRGDGYFVRPQAELARLLGRAYGADIIPDRLMPGFAAIAWALGIKNLCLAQIAAVHLRLPDLPGTIERIGVEAEDMLIKLERVMEQFVRVAWDEAEHPRTGTPPNPGWFASRNGSSVGQAPTQVAANEREERKPDEELDPLAEVRQAQWEAGIATLRRIDPNNANLTYFANPGAVPNQAALDRLNAAIETAAVQRVTNKLMPGGRPIGLPGTSPRVRVLPGGIKGAQGLFDYLRVGGAVETSGSAITVVKLPGRAGHVTFRLTLPAVLRRSMLTFPVFRSAGYTFYEADIWQNEHHNRRIPKAVESRLCRTVGTSQGRPGRTGRRDAGRGEGGGVKDR